MTLARTGVRAWGAASVGRPGNAGRPAPRVDARR